jgi:hypothetical protein
MKNNISKFRNINEANLNLEKRYLTEQLKNQTQTQPQQTKTTTAPNNTKNAISVDISPISKSPQEMFKGVSLTDQEKDVIHSELKKDPNISNFLSLETNSDWLSTLKSHAKIKASAKGLTIEIPKLGKSHNVSLNLGAKLTGNVWDPSAKLGSVNVGAKINF